MKRVVEQGGLAPGGLNFDAKAPLLNPPPPPAPSLVPRSPLSGRAPPTRPPCASRARAAAATCQVRRESTDVEDLFIGHINGMDNYARGLRAAVRLINDGTLDQMREERYADFSSTAIGKKFSEGKASLAELAAHAATHPEPPQRSAQCLQSSSMLWAG